MVSDLPHSYTVELTERDREVLVHLIEMGVAELARDETPEELEAIKKLWNAPPTGPNERDSIIEECALHAEKMVERHPHWTNDEHDGILLAALAIRELKRPTATEGGNK